MGWDVAIGPSGPVLIEGKLGVGKRFVAKKIHTQSLRSASPLIVFECGIKDEDSVEKELFGYMDRVGMLEHAHNGTLIVSDIHDLPLNTQSKLVQFLTSGWIMRVNGKEKISLNVRIIATSKVQLVDLVATKKFREDLYYRLSTIDISLPPLRERKDDIHLLFRKFAADFASKYKMPPIKLEDDAVQLLVKFRWSGNIRQLRNIAEQLSVLETRREITSTTLLSYLPQDGGNLPSVVGKKSESDFSTERDILYKVLFDMKSDLQDLKKLTLELMKNGASKVQESNQGLIQRIYGHVENNLEEFPNQSFSMIPPAASIQKKEHENKEDDFDYEEASELDEKESVSLLAKELELIKKSLERNKGKRKATADELGISERTLYRKIKEFDL